MAELKGTVTLDSESMEALRKEIREEVIKEMEKDGLYLPEVVKYLYNCEYTGIKVRL